MNKNVKTLVESFFDDIDDSDWTHDKSTVNALWSINHFAECNDLDDFISYIINVCKLEDLVKTVKKHIDEIQQFRNLHRCKDDIINKMVTTSENAEYIISYDEETGIINYKPKNKWCPYLSIGIGIMFNRVQLSMSNVTTAVDTPLKNSRIDINDNMSLDELVKNVLWFKNDEHFKRYIKDVTFFDNYEPDPMTVETVKLYNDIIADIDEDEHGAKLVSVYEYIKQHPDVNKIHLLALSSRDTNMTGSDIFLIHFYTETGYRKSKAVIPIYNTFARFNKPISTQCFMYAQNILNKLRDKENIDEFVLKIIKTMILYTNNEN